jgi:hypothetical protein
MTSGTVGVRLLGMNTLPLFDYAEGVQSAGLPTSEHRNETLELLPHRGAPISLIRTEAQDQCKGKIIGVCVPQKS